MSRSSKLIGMILSVVLFAGLLCPLPNWSKPMSVDATGFKALIESLLQALCVGFGREMSEKRPPAPPTPGVSVDSSPTQATGSGDFIAGKSDPGPSLSFEWQGPGHLLSTAETLGLRVVAVGPSGLVGQVVRQGSSIFLTTFDASPSDFSQTTRALPSSFFGPELVQAAGRPVSEYLVLFPPNVEQTVADAVRSAVQHEGKSMASVSGVRGELTTVNGRPKVRITHIFERS